MAVIASTLSPLLAADTLMLSLYFDKKFTSVALLTGYQLLGVAVGGLLFVPSSRVWGKRHAFLIGNVLCIITAAWGGASNHNYKSLLAARFFQGIALAPFEALVNAVVGDLYFVHERGKRMALTNFCVFGGSFMTPIIVGKMSHTLGWQWTFYFVAIFSAVMFPFMFFFVPEVAFKREDKFNTDIIVWESGVMGLRADRANVDPEKKVEDSPPGSSRIHDNTTATGPTTTPPKRKTFWESLKPFDGRKTDENFFKLALRPFPLMFHPAVFWVCNISLLWFA
jgi:MFS family permease